MTNKKTTKPKKRNSRKPKKVEQTRFEAGITFVMAGVIPAMALATVRIAGICYSAGLDWLAGFAGLLTLVVLAVSIPHVATAVGLITKSGKRVSWTVALAFDGGVVLAELVHACGPEVLGEFALVMMVMLTALSAVLNAFAFTRH